MVKHLNQFAQTTMNILGYFKQNYSYKKLYLFCKLNLSGNENQKTDNAGVVDFVISLSIFYQVKKNCLKTSFRSVQINFEINSGSKFLPLNDSYRSSNIWEVIQLSKNTL